MEKSTSENWHFVKSERVKNLFVSVIHCPAVPFVAAAEYDATETHYGTVVTYACKRGFWIKRGLNVQMIECKASGNWSNTKPRNCTGMNVYNTLQRFEY